MNQGHLAKKAHMTDANLSQILNGASPTLVTVEKIARAFGITVSQILTDQDLPNADPLFVEPDSWEVVHGWIELVRTMMVSGKIPKDLWIPDGLVPSRKLPKNKPSK